MNATLTYEQVVDSTRASYDNAPELATKRAETYLMVSANLRTFLPDLPPADYARFFADILYYQHIAGIDEKIVTKAGDMIIEGMTDGLWDAVAGKPTIFCTCHLGSYRLMNLVLARLGAPFSLLIDNRTYREQGEKFIRIQDEAAVHFGQKPGQMALIDAEQPTAGLQLIRALKQGRILVAYLDGNTGTGGVTRQDDKLVGVEFLGRPLLARKGIAFLSVATQTPIVPVFAYRPDAYTNVLHVMEARHPGHVPAEAREATVATLTQHLYDDFATLLRQYPSQWEGWFYVQKYLDLAAIRAGYEAAPVADRPAKTDWLFNHDRYANVPDPSGNAALLFDKHLYRSFKITDQLSELLRAPSIRLDAIRKPELIEMLVRQGILC
jgi:lauroyl/myristoyl acyltransferase